MISACATLLPLCNDFDVQLLLEFEYRTAIPHLRVTVLNWSIVPVRTYLCEETVAHILKDSEQDGMKHVRGASTMDSLGTVRTEAYSMEGIVDVLLRKFLQGVLIICLH